MKGPLLRERSIDRHDAVGNKAVNLSRMGVAASAQVGAVIFLQVNEKLPEVKKIDLQFDSPWGTWCLLDPFP